MAIIFIIVAAVAFIPTSLLLVSKVESGVRPSPPLILHVHAATMVLWLVLFLLQSVLIKKRKYPIHKMLGLASAVLAIGILLSMYGVEFSKLERLTSSPTVLVEQAYQSTYSFLLIHSTSYIFFSLFYLWAIFTTHKDSETHKRMMVLAALTLMIPGLGRLINFAQVLPDFGLSLVDSRHLYLFILISPAIIYDIITKRTLHRSYMIGLSLLLLWAIAAHFLWGSSLWMDKIAPMLLGNV